MKNKWIEFGYIIIWSNKMAEDNPWKRQAQMNRIKAEGKP